MSSTEPAFENLIPEGDHLERAVCTRCGFIDYQNPKMVVGSVIATQERILLCRRAIEPRSGFWTVPAGYLELHETPDEGAAREAAEEANADIAIEGILGVYSIPHISQIQIMFRATFRNQVVFSPGIESLDVRLFEWADIPWQEIAFPSVHWALHAWYRGRHASLGLPDRNPA
jgi:ADP-ribose pyrophosphatase YjhB (NUDIX family)